MATVLTVLTVPTMHEDVQQRAGQDEKIGQDAEHVGPVLGHQQERTDDEEDDQADRGLEFAWR